MTARPWSEAYTASTFRKFKRTVTEDTGAGANSPYNFDLASGVTIPATSSPALAIRGGTRLIYVRGSNNRIYEKSSNGTTWNNWVDLGNPGLGSTSDPAAAAVPSIVANSPDTYFVANGQALFGSKTVKIRGRTNMAWGAWQSLGAPSVGIGSAPAIVTTSGNDVSVFVRGSTDGMLYFKRCSLNCNGSSGVWGNWTVVPGGIFIGKPTAVARAPGIIDVFVHGLDHGLYMVESSGFQWGPFFGVPGGAILKSDPACPDCTAPAVGSRHANNFDIYMRGLNDQVGLTSWSATTGWTGPTPVGGLLRSSPGAVSTTNAPGQVVVSMPQETSAGTFSFGIWWKERI